MHEDMASGIEYRDVLELTGLSYDNQLWIYSLGLYHFSKIKDYSNLMRDKWILRRMITIGLYNNNETKN